MLVLCEYSYVSSPSGGRLIDHKMIYAPTRADLQQCFADAMEADCLLWERRYRSDPLRPTPRSMIAWPKPVDARLLKCATQTGVENW